MTSETYEAFRNELIHLLQKTQSLDCIPEEKKTALRRICSKTLENQFEIVLAGEFQGGKSTTFNAFCDGRELSPRGSGVKTSGCLLSVQNLADPDEPESACIEWKNSMELVSGFSDLLFSHLKNLDPNRFEGCSAADMDAAICLSDPSDRALIAGAAADEWQVWKKNRIGYDPDNKGKLDILRSAVLISKFYGNDELEQFQQHTAFDPDTVGRMAVFPTDWENRWLSEGASSFQLSEILFLFIRSVKIKIHSKNLSRIGCAVIDCPGLFASRWDTEIARNAMASADAVLYLLDGSRTLKRSDLRSLRFMKDNGVLYKTLYGCNMRGLSFKNSQRIALSTIDQLNQMNFSVDAGDFSMFHALLALLSIQCENLNQNRPDCRNSVLNILSILDMEECDAASSEDKAVIQIARNVSGWDHLLTMIENRVLQKKARLILIDHGAQPAIRSLAEAEGSLKIREIAAIKKEKEFYAHLELIENQLKLFKDRSFVILGRLDSADPDAAIADDFQQRIRAGKETLLETISSKTFQETSSLIQMVSLLSRKKLADRISGVIIEETDAWLKSAISEWITEIKTGRNAVYKTYFIKTIRSMNTDLKQLWESSGLPDENWLEGAFIPEFTGDILVDHNKLFYEVEQSRIFNAIASQTVAAGAAGFFSAASGVFAAVVIAMARALRIAAASAAVALVNIVFLLLAKTVIQNTIKEEIKAGLDPVISNLFREIETCARKEFMAFSAGIRSYYKHLFLTALEKPQTIVEHRKQEAETVFRKTRQNRVEAANEAKSIRENVIAPLRMEIEDFMKRSEEFFVKMSVTNA